MAFKPFTTHTGLLLYVSQEEGEHVVTIVGDSIKELLRTPDRRAAEKYANGIKAHYEQREKDEKVNG